MKLIPLTKGLFAKVDDEDYDLVSKYKWNAWRNPTKNTFYACAKIDGKVIKMHRVVLGLSDPSILVDHKFGDGLDNQKKHLRICNRFENARNSPKRCTNTSGYKGVYAIKGRNGWSAKIFLNKKLLHLGFFDTKEDAARAYNCGARTLYLDFARFNDVSPLFPEQAISIPDGLGNKNGFIGIWISGKKWAAGLISNKARVYLGVFSTPEEAARAYDAAAKIHHGSKAKLNFE